MSKRLKNKRNRDNSEFEGINLEQRNALFSYDLNLPHNNNRSVPNSSRRSIDGEYEPCLDLSEIATESSTGSSNSINRRRITSIHRNNTVKQVTVALKPNIFTKSLEIRRKWMNPSGMMDSSLEQHASKIADRMARDTTLMGSTPESNQLRREALRDMPQCLTIKRLIKKKLNSSIHQRSKDKSVALYNSVKHLYNKKVSKAHNSVKSLAYSFELWYDSLKIIEGHFGSGVATYFKFFRWLFLMNCFVAFFVFVFIVIPQLLYKKHNDDFRNSSGVNIYDSDNTTAILPTNLILKGKSMQDGVPFRFVDVFTGEGYFTNTTLYYGYYVNDTINNIANLPFNLPYSYFFTMTSVYLASFIALSTSMARSYRKSFIETQGGLKNVFALKVFCGWDYSIATSEAAKLKSSSIFNELREILSESVKTSKKKSFVHRFWTTIIQIIINIQILAVLIGIGYLMWYLLEKYGTDIDNPSSGLAIVTAILINAIMSIFPTIFSFLVRYEDYKNPRAALYITLIRVFFLKVIIVGVFLSFWLTHSTNQFCWETEIGQHIYRLILFNFLFSVLISAIIEASRFAIYKYLWKPIGIPECDIARYTLQLIYNQTLFWVGLYFSPLLSVIVVILLWFTWYIRRTCVLKFCRPSSKSWRAAQTHTWFLILSFLSLLLVLITYGYIIANVQTSNCGPFREYKFTHEMVLKGILKLEQHNMFWKILMYFRKPGTVALILIGMCVIVYYLRAKAISEKHMVNLLRDMLVLEAKDKEFLLKNISRVTEGQWQYNIEGKNEGTWNILNSLDTASTSQQPLTETSVDSD